MATGGPYRWAGRGGAGGATTAFLPKHVRQAKASSLEEAKLTGLEESTQPRQN